MQLDLGNNIRQLRHRDKRTQEALAEALGVTAQAVSRWESGGCYPDMNLIPSIANYFGVSIDELFGYTNQRERRDGARRAPPFGGGRPRAMLAPDASVGKVGKDTIQGLLEFETTN